MDTSRLGLSRIQLSESGRPVLSLMTNQRANESGICSECGGQIETERLMILPTTDMCVRCRKEYEQARRVDRNTA